MKKPDLKKIPNVSLLSGYLFILLVFISFSFVQFSSTRNLKELETGVLQLLYDLPGYRADNLDAAVARFQRLRNTDIFTALNATFTEGGNNLPSGPIDTIEDLYLSLEELGRILDVYNHELFRSQTILFITFICLSVILSILLTVSEFDQVKKYERERYKRLTDRKLLDILEGERNLIAVELHDDVAQKLSVISQHFNMSMNEEHTDLLKRYNSDVIHKIRTMAHSLRSPEFENSDFQKQIEFLFADFRSVSSIKLDGSFNGLSALVLDGEKKLHVYRVIQELLSNCRKHSSASRLSISLLYVHPVLRIIYRDNGVGMDTEGEYTGLGLKSIKYRLRILNAEIQKVSEDGLKIQINIPVAL